MDVVVSWVDHHIVSCLDPFIADRFTENSLINGSATGGSFNHESLTPRSFIHESLIPSSFIQGSFIEGSIFRQIVALYLITIFGCSALYLFTSSLSYFIFFHVFRSTYHPRREQFPGQEWAEISMALNSVPVMAHLTVPFLLGEVNGYARLYDTVDEYGWWYLICSLIGFIAFSDTLIYWIHRGLHEVPWLYKNIHKAHHKWKYPTPFAAFAFHPVDGWAQSLPYHVFPYLFPVHKCLSLFAFVGVQIWGVVIHDGVHFIPFNFVNGAAHQTIHHTKFLYNYGQFFTFWDRWCGTHFDPFKEKKLRERVRQ